MNGPRPAAQNRRPVADARVAAVAARLPRFRRAEKLWAADAAAGPRLGALGVKLFDAAYYLGRLAGFEFESQREGAGRRTESRVQEYSREADAFIFTCYGALDAVSHLIVTVADLPTDEEVKFPMIARLLGESGQAERWEPLTRHLEAVYEAGWFRDLRRLRNVVNYQGILTGPAEWPAIKANAPDWSLFYDEVVDTIETALRHLQDAAAAPPHDRW